MRKINFIAALLIMLMVSFNLLSLRVFSQSSGSSSDTYTILLTNKTGKTSLNSPTSALNITVTPGGQDVAGLDTGVSLSAMGASILLSNVDTIKNVITVVWSGGITDGKATLTGKLKQGNSVAPNFIVVKVEKDGGIDITNDVNVTVTLSSSVSSSSSSSSSGEIISSSSSSSSGSSTLSSSGGSPAVDPSVTITAPEEFIIKSKSPNTFKLKITGANFKSTSKCTIEVSDDSLLRIRPLKFLLSKGRSTKTFLAKVPTLGARDLISNESSDIATVDVSCTNDASDSVDIILTPDGLQ